MQGGRSHGYTVWENRIRGQACLFMWASSLAELSRFLGWALTQGTKVGMLSVDFFLQTFSP